MILWLMVARGGSKGVPRKNLRQLGGMSLVGWKAEAARVAMRMLPEAPGRLVISTDSAEIADEAKRHGVEVPWLRPSTLATDDARSVDVVRHALQTVGGSYSTVVLLEPSAPFTTASHYVAGYHLYCEREAHLVVGMKHTEPHSSFIGEVRDDGALNALITKMNAHGRDTRRQARAQEWTMNGAMYIFRSEVVTDERYQWTGDWSIYNGARNYGYLMDRWHSIEIDTPHDLEMAEYAVARGYVTVPPGRWL